ncbi:MAG TPA: polymer-forming cytoskeletal protein, partial [Firmicutes bacterium]|nr:polymer-forming cytoskeletal protein [Bacillota bacterium]
IQIKGDFDGKINNGDQVLILSTGSLKGEITTKSLEIYGIVEGNVTAKNLLIRSSGQLRYDNLVYNDLFVEEGGILVQAGGRRSQETRD